MISVVRVKNSAAMNFKKTDRHHKAKKKEKHHSNHGRKVEQNPETLASIKELIQKAVLTDQSFSSQQIKSKELFLTAIKELKNHENPQIRRISKEVEKFLLVPFNKHKLSPQEIFSLCLVADKTLQQVSKTAEKAYLRVKESHLPRALVIDGNTHCFYALSKKFGELNASGTFKKVTDAVEVCEAPNDEFTSRNVVRLVNKPGKRLPEKEILLHEKYGQILTWVQYPSIKYPDETRTTIIEEAYQTDLYSFCNYDSIKIKRKMPLKEIIQVLYETGTTLAKMHHDGISHQDFKAKNGLYRKDADGSTHSKVTDFGHSVSPEPTTEVDRTRRHTYGTVRYSAPELIDKNLLLPNLLEQRKAEDMYAMGCILQELLTFKPLPWVSTTYKAFKDPNPKKFKTEALFKQEKAFTTLLQTGVQNSPDPLLHLEWVSARLLDINPSTRMKIDEFLEAIRPLLEIEACNIVSAAP